MGKGSKNRTQDKKRFDAEYERVFGKKTTNKQLELDLANKKGAHGHGL